MADDFVGLPFFNGEAYEILKQRCREIRLDPIRLEEMVRRERDVAGMGRRHGIMQELEAIVQQSLQDVEE